MLKKLASGVIASAFLLSTVRAHAALDAYVYIVGQKSGPIKGSVTQQGREGSILVLGASHSVVSPRDPQSGLPTGKRMHKPFVITKEIDKSSPILYSLLDTNENLSSVTIKFWTPQVRGATGSSSEVQSYTVTLTNASIASITFHDTNDKTTADEAPKEDVAFTYQKITWTWNDGGITSGDTWQQN
jgi:type VI secretion system secreted protein Hcp